MLPPNGLNPHPQYHPLLPLFGTALGEWNFWINFFVSIGFLVGFVWGVLKVVEKTRRWLKRRHTQEVAAEVTQTLDPVINSLVKAAVSELLPNGGGSIKDAINRIEKRQDVADRTLVELDTKVDVVISLLQKP